MSKKILYITGQTPYGLEEAFITEEMLSLKKNGIKLLIIPRNPSKNLIDKEANNLFDDTLRIPLMSFVVIRHFFIFFAKHPKKILKILYLLFKNARSVKIAIKNLAILPKSVYITNVIKDQSIDHIHIQWGGTTATMGYIIHQLTNIPWSFTVHRGDIKENNMLKEKVRSATFTRCSSQQGKNTLIAIIGEEYNEKIKVVYTGLKIPKNISTIHKRNNDHHKFTIITPANLLEVKGHIYLIEACYLLIKNGIANFQTFFYGDGPLRSQLENLIKEKGLSDYIKTPRRILHEKLIAMYRNKEIDAVILPSIITDDNQHEGIPIAIIEAMMWGIPVISTNTGAIPELLSNDTGILVEQKNPEALADAIKHLRQHQQIRETLSQNGYQKVLKEFNIDQTTKKLIKLYG